VALAALAGAGMQNGDAVVREPASKSNNMIKTPEFLISDRTLPSQGIIDFPIMFIGTEFGKIHKSQRWGEYRETNCNFQMCSHCDEISNLQCLASFFSAAPRGTTLVFATGKLSGEPRLGSAMNSQ
jgi:hypothetical protein